MSLASSRERVLTEERFLFSVEPDIPFPRGLSASLQEHPLRRTLHSWSLGFLVPGSCSLHGRSRWEEEPLRRAVSALLQLSSLGPWSSHTQLPPPCGRPWDIGRSFSWLSFYFLSFFSGRDSRSLHPYCQHRAGILSLSPPSHTPSDKHHSTTVNGFLIGITLDEFYCHTLVNCLPGGS